MYSPGHMYTYTRVCAGMGRGSRACGFVLTFRADLKRYKTSTSTFLHTQARTYLRMHTYVPMFTRVQRCLGTCMFVWSMIKERALCPLAFFE